MAGGSGEEWNSPLLFLRRYDQHRNSVRKKASSVLANIFIL